MDDHLGALVCLLRVSLRDGKDTTSHLGNALDEASREQDEVWKAEAASTVHPPQACARGLALPSQGRGRKSHTWRAGCRVNLPQSVQDSSRLGFSNL